MKNLRAIVVYLGAENTSRGIEYSTIERNDSLPRDIFATSNSVPCATSSVIRIFRNEVHLGHDVNPRDL